MSASTWPAAVMRRNRLDAFGDGQRPGGGFPPQARSTAASSMSS